MKLLILLPVGLVFLLGCLSVTKPQIEYIQVLPSDIALCGSLDRINSEDLARLNQGEIKVPFDPSMHPRLIGQVSDLPLINANDNRTPAGKIVDGVLELDLEVVLSDLRCENNRRPGLRVAAIAEKGKPATVPGPLIRIETGARIRAQITNSLQDSTITVFGFQKRPSAIINRLFIQPGESETVDFDAGETADFAFTPGEPGAYELIVGYPRKKWVQKWEVTAD